MINRNKTIDAIERIMATKSICFIKNNKAIVEAMNAMTNGSNLFTLTHCSISNTTNKAVAANSIPFVLNDKAFAVKAPIVHPRTQYNWANSVMKK